MYELIEAISFQVNDIKIILVVMEILVCLLLLRSFKKMIMQMEEQHPG